MIDDDGYLIPENSAAARRDRLLGGCLAFTGIFVALFVVALLLAILAAG